MHLATHPNSESGRGGRIFAKDHQYAGELMPPLKDHVEGGKSFSNRVDNFYIIHRHLKIDHMRYTTLVDVAKVKDKETGGNLTLRDQEIYCDFNSGLGFTVMGKSGINRNPLPAKDKGLLIDDEPDDLPF